MAKAQLDLDSAMLEKIRPLAVKNGIKPNIKNLVNLALKVTSDMIEVLDSIDFENVCNLKK